MEYVLIGIPAVLVAWMIGLWVHMRSKRPLPQPQRISVSDKMERLTSNRFISPRVLQNLQERQHVGSVSATTGEAARVPVVQKGKRPPEATKQTEKQAADDLNATCLGLLSAAAIEHPSGHTKLVARYILRSKDHDRIEVMFEKAGSGRARLWLTRNCAAELMNNAIAFREYPAADLYQPQEGDSTPSYGRHPALKSMRDLANADLIRFTIDRVDQLRTIISKLAPSVTTPAPVASAGSQRAAMPRGEHSAHDK